MELQVFESVNDEAIKLLDEQTKGTYSGYVYAIEWNNTIKIGCTRKPYTRFHQFILNSKYAGNENGVRRVVISPMHTNYRRNEKILHRIFGTQRVRNLELFSTTLEEVINEFSNLEYEDKNKEIHKKHSDRANAMAKSFENACEEGFNATIEKMWRDALSEEKIETTIANLSKVLEAFIDLKNTYKGRNSLKVDNYLNHSESFEQVLQESTFIMPVMEFVRRFRPTGMGVDDFNSVVRECLYKDGYATSGDTQPTKKALDECLMVYEETAICYPNGTTETEYRPFLTGDGVAYLINELLIKK